ncbi:MAG: hypothetical protein QOF53_2275 [Nocardioidaceae bacterium]|nr:hypothetical protein [Nocardioidaceae bacterium]
MLFDDDTRLAFMTGLDGPWDVYMEDFLTSEATLSGSMSSSAMSSGWHTSGRPIGRREDDRNMALVHADVALMWRRSPDKDSSQSPYVDEPGYRPICEQ